MQLRFLRLTFAGLRLTRAHIVSQFAQVAAKVKFHVLMQQWERDTVGCKRAVDLEGGVKALGVSLKCN